MSELGIWIGLSGLCITIIGTAVKLTWWLGAKFDDITNALNDHELKDEERQTEVLQRITRVETIVLNGSVRRHLV